ncbi:hypothetical protein B0H14DRAFT_3076744, partial [Mycena olivaceomarginata]
RPSVTLFLGWARILVAQHPDRTPPPPRSPRLPSPSNRRQARPEASSSQRRLSISLPLVADLDPEREAGKMNGVVGWRGKVSLDSM